MQAVLITPNGPDGSWCQGSDYLGHHDNPTRDRVARSTRPAVFCLVRLATQYQIRQNYLHDRTTAQLRNDAGAARSCRREAVCASSHTVPTVPAYSIQ